MTRLKGAASTPAMVRLRARVDEDIEETTGRRVIFSLIIWPDKEGAPMLHLCNAPERAKGTIRQLMRHLLERWDEDDPL